MPEPFDVTQDETQGTVLTPTFTDPAFRATDADGVWPAAAECLPGAGAPARAADLLWDPVTRTFTRVRQ